MSMDSTTQLIQSQQDKESTTAENKALKKQVKELQTSTYHYKERQRRKVQEYNKHLQSLEDDL